MKLISFAVVSLLGIVVSAYPGLGTSDADDAQQLDQYVIKDKIRELTEAHQLQQELIFKLGGLGEVEYRERETKSTMKELWGILEENIVVDDEKLDLEKQYDTAVEDWQKAHDTLITKTDDLIRAEEKRNGIEIKLLILNENIERQKKEQEAHSKGQMKASPGSSSHREILEKQIDETCRNADDLSAANKDVSESIDRLDDIMKRTNDPKKKLELSQTRDKFLDSRDFFVREVEFAQGRCGHARVLQAEIGWKPQTSLAGGVVQSLLQKFGIN
ncbi:hypothetical protein BASA50_007659 [Batrachochytrium salamandrivorans]|uniref:Uncharacterized protein n=1 Tax=Batrachochytrium salamandrivorans TaxID=1357716 RepID=A0ABQ8F6D6_9FUNG|nr:hypothetical protein BASA50_007659 [Batrachochytrium salamandrivorans]